VSSSTPAVGLGVPPEPTDETSLGARERRDQRAVRSIAWTSAGKYAGQAFRWGSTFIVVRLLTPEDYGLVGMTSLFSGLVALVAEFGVSTAVIRMRELDDEQLGQVNGLAVIVGGLAMLVGVLAAWPISLLFDRAELVPIVVVSSLGFLLASFQTVPSALLQRRTDFKTIAGVEFWGALLMATLVLALAALGSGYWALVIPNLVMAVWNSFAFRRKAYVRLLMPKVSRIREAYRYSVLVISGRFTGYLFANADFFIVGRMFGSSALGSYGMAWDLANTPNDQINGLIARVSTPYYSELQNDRRELFRFFLLLVEGVCCVSLPLVLGLATVSPEFVSLFLGDKWSSMVTVLRMLCILATMRVAPILVNPLLAMVGDAAFQARVTTIALFIVPPLLAAAGYYNGVNGIATCWLLVYPVMIATFVLRATKLFRASAFSVLRAMWPAIACSGIMVGAVIVTRELLPSTSPLAVRFAVLVGAGAVAYLVSLLAFFGDRVRKFKALAARSFT
jgi:teichuronic acid exporter